ncbi:MAG TPA: ankyrin repeat domain-containing protein, partial [Candidatus Limnocylindria bacterium]|nr:ankyrin repeat domain-containing protein [Candidatus Limnocylindria bacterium]
LGQQYADKNNKKAAELLINDVIAERMVAGLKKDVKNRTEMRSPLTILLTAQDTPYVSTLTNLQRLIDANDEEQLRAYLSDRSNTIKTTTNKATLQAALDYAQKKGSRFIPILTQAVQNKKTRLEELADALNDYPRGVEEVIRGRETPLLIAARRFDVPVVELLLSRKADVNFHDTANGQTALHEAVKDEGHEESRKDLVEVLLRYHPDVDVVNREQETPLMLASAFDRSLLVRLLLDHHASVNVQDRYGRTALIWAAEQNSLDSARLLLEHGANKDIQDKRNKRAIDYATAPAMRALLTK